MNPPAVQTMLLCRPELAARLGVCPRTLKKFEAAWGFTAARVATGTRTVLYRRDLAMEIAAKIPTVKT